MSVIHRLNCGYLCWRVIVLFSLTFLCILPILCNYLKFSIYYGVVWPINMTEETNKLREQNDERFLLARQHLKFATDKHKMSDHFKFTQPNNLTDIIITVITVSRKTSTYNPNYLTQTVSKLLEQLMSGPRRKSFSFGLMICNVDNLPDDYDEAKELSLLFHTVVKYKNGESLNMERFDKEKQDYTYCLEQSLVYHPKYVLLMEDDAYPTNRMLSVLEYSVQNIFEDKVSEFSRQHSQIAYLKLYHPERLLNFISIEFYRLFELAAAISLLWTVFVILNKKRVIHMNTSRKFFSITGAYVVLLALTIGRQNFLGVRRISKHFHSFVPAPSCCTPANLYSFSSAVAILNSFSGKNSYKGHAKDALLDEFLAESNYKAIYVEPNIFKHIGQYSSLRHGSILNPYVVK